MQLEHNNTLQYLLQNSVEQNVSKNIFFSIFRVRKTPNKMLKVEVRGNLKKYNIYGPSALCLPKLIQFCYKVQIYTLINKIWIGMHEFMMLHFQDLEK